MVKVGNVQKRRDIGHLPDEPAPAGLDYDTWTGPVPQLPFNRNRFHGTVNWHWHYGAGDLGNDSVHFMDVARWALQVEYPEQVIGMGCKLYFDDDQQTPDTVVAAFDFPGTCVTWEHRVWSRAGSEDGWITLYGEKGTLVFDRKGWHVADGVEASDKAQEIEKPHLRNFLDCIRSGRRPNADIEEGHKSTRLCHLGNIAYRTGRALRFDARTETCLGDPEANRLLGRSYRAPFVLPERV